MSISLIFTNIEIQSYTPPLLFPQNRNPIFFKLKKKFSRIIFYFQILSFSFFPSLELPFPLANISTRSLNSYFVENFLLFVFPCYHFRLPRATYNFFFSYKLNFNCYFCSNYGLATCFSYFENTPPFLFF